MKNKKNVTVSNPDELNKYLQHTSFGTWIILGLVSVVLLGFFVWSVLFKMEIKITGKATVSGGAVTLHVDSANADKLAVNQKVIIENQEGKIESFNDDHQPVVSSFTLENGEYTYTIVYQKRPVEFLIGK